MTEPPEETCDDGNRVSGDGCSAECDFETPELTAGVNFSCALARSGAVKCWGDNSYGALGLGDTEPRGDQPGEMGDALPTVNLGSGRRAIRVVAGDRSACAILDDGSLKCWGGNDWGTLGLGDTNNRGDEPGEMGDALPAVDLGIGRTAKSVAVGRHICAVLDDGSVKCWGLNSYSQLGLGDDNNRGDEPGEMGEALPRVDLGTGRKATNISVGPRILRSCSSPSA
jgi:cysteine-rich repeat protein